MKDKQLISAKEVYGFLGGKRDVRTGEKVDGEISFKEAERHAREINEQYNRDRKK